MDQQQESKLKKLGVFTRAQAEAMGLSHQNLTRLVRDEKLKRLERGVYLHPEAELEGDVGFQIACTRFGPDAAVGGLSALFHYNLAEQVPGHIWMIVPPGKRTNAHGYKLIRTKVPQNLQIVEKNGYRIVTIERAILEGLKFVTKIGERTGIKAARDALAKGLTTELKLGKAAKELGLKSVLVKYFEAIIP